MNNKPNDERLAKRDCFLTRFTLLLTALLSILVLGQADENSRPDFKVRTGVNANMPKLAKVLPKHTQVFGLYIHATAKVPDAKLLHAANIAAEYLDNDLDGKPDNPQVNQLLWDESAGIVMAANEREMENLWDRHESILERYQLQDLYATETLPNGGPHNPNTDEFDASLEEILHIITSVGYAEVYPSVFGEHRGSDLTKAMDIARGGYFRRVPRSYPAKAWYTYDDRTCDYECQATEYIYWALTSLLGGQNFGDRGEDIEDEWKLNTPAKLRAKDKAIVKLLTNPKYNLPTRLPNGKYEKKREDGDGGNGNNGGGDDGDQAGDHNAAPDFKILSGTNPRMPKLKPALPKYVRVFGLHIHATAKVPNAKLLHAAKIAAGYLDNNLDGTPDNPQVNKQIWDEYGAIMMPYNERESEQLFDTDGDALDHYAIQDLFASETFPNGGPHNPNSDEFDAALEEILHTITSVGYATVYPDVFGEKKGTALAKAMDIARGGYFRTVPRSYPAKAWYTYDDGTCDYGCQVTEYIYWSLTSLLGGQNFGDRGEDIEDEWKLNTPAKLRAKDKAIVKLLTDPQYRLPTRLPDGKYQVRHNQPLQLNILRADGLAKFNLSSNDLPKGKTIVIESSANLKKWEVAKRIPMNTSRFNFPFNTGAVDKFYRLRQE